MILGTAGFGRDLAVKLAVSAVAGATTLAWHRFGRWWSRRRKRLRSRRWATHSRLTDLERSRDEHDDRLTALEERLGPSDDERT